MFFSWKRQPKYKSIPRCDANRDIKRYYIVWMKFSSASSTTIGFGFLLVVLIFLGGFILGFSNREHSSPPNEEHQCQDPTIRREWRSLTGREQKDYIDAVNCLASQGSIFMDEASLWDDFAWVHSRVGGFAQGSAPFLAWHRYFIYYYEAALRGLCGYNGYLAYWDWTLDWEDLARSPIFDSVVGFGGDGDASGEITIGQDGHCVTAGPFANHTVFSYRGKIQPHCLSRAFATGKKKQDIGSRVKPENIRNITEESDYNGFLTRLETVVHTAILSFMGADFFVSSAPNDPVFFLHHTQLDRLWWTWQKLKPESRLMEYNGWKERHINESATLEDILPLTGMAPEVPVASMMDTQKGILCYRY